MVNIKKWKDRMQDNDNGCANRSDAMQYEIEELRALVEQHERVFGEIFAVTNTKYNATGGGYLVAVIRKANELSAEQLSPKRKNDG